MFCTPRLIFGGTQGIRNQFLILHSRICFRRFRVRLVTFSRFVRLEWFRWSRGRQVPFSCWVSFSCFVLSELFPAVPRPSGAFFIFCAPGLFFGGTEGLGSRFHLVRSRTHCRRLYHRHLVLFSFFALPDSLLAVPRASTHFHVLCS
jgi:hypothetical protein